MFRKKGFWVWGGIGLAIIAAILTGVVLIGQKKNGNAMTRYEWIKMLAERFGMEEYVEETPYFRDVDNENPNFATVQAAVEWDVLEPEDRFDGDKPVTGEFASVTAVRALSRYRWQLYLEADEEPDDEAYFRLACENGLLEEEHRKETLEKEECDSLLDAVQELNETVLWKDDYIQTVSRKNVKELPAGSVEEYDAQAGSALLEKSVAETLQPGDIILFETAHTGFYTAGKIQTLDSSGSVTMLQPSLEEIYDTLILSDVVHISPQDTQAYYELGDGVLELGPRASAYLPNSSVDRIIPVRSFQTSYQDKGLSFLLTSEEDTVKIQVTDNNTGASFEQSLDVDLGEGGGLECAFELKDISIGAQVVWKHGGLQYADVQMYASLTEKINANILSQEKEIPLGALSVPLAGGIASVKLDLSLILSVEGDIRIEASLPAGAHFSYERGKGLRSIPLQLSYTEPKIELTAKAEAMLSPGIALKVLFIWDAAELRLKAGVTAEAEAQLHSTQTCTDLSVAGPVVSLAVSVDPIVTDPLSKEWELLSAEDAPFRWERHYEMYQDGSAGFVETCTWKDSGTEKETPEDQKPEDAEGVNLTNTYVTRHGDIRFAFDYPDTWSVSGDWYDKVVGDSSSHEWVMLKNERGANIVYYEWIRDHLGAGGVGQKQRYWETSKAAESRLDSFVVGKVQLVGSYDIDFGQELTTEDETVYYALMPENEAGTEKSGMGFTGLYDSFTFAYGSSWYYFMASSPSDGFTKEEEQEVLAILSSFRLAEGTAETDNSDAEDDILNELRQGDFSRFAGVYQATENDSDACGGGEPLEPLVLQEDGAITGGAPKYYYGEPMYPANEPISVEKMEDGSYLCQLTYERHAWQSYYYIYPPGTAGHYTAGLDAQTLTDALYIECLIIEDSVLDIIYIKDGSSQSGANDGQDVSNPPAGNGDNDGNGDDGGNNGGYTDLGYQGERDGFVYTPGVGYVPMIDDEPIPYDENDPFPGAAPSEDELSGEKIGVM